MKTAEETRGLDRRSSPPPIKTPGRVPSSKILSAHLDKLAVVYVRQSTTHQVQENRESTARQYAFAEHAIALGWPRERVLIIDEDLGKSGRTAEGRSGFQRLVSEVTLNHVGLVLGLEMSRLARSSRDWHNLFEVCGICSTLLADEDGVYDAKIPTTDSCSA
jgi:DNA invertase Pin-like site-specific DNA recombinase